MAKRKVLNLKKRPCKIGLGINTRTEKHGDDDVPACDIPLEGVMLEAKELDALLGDGAHKALFASAGKGSVDEPRLRQLKPLKLKDKFEECAATIFVGMDDAGEVEIENAKLANITLEPQVGGLTAMSLKVQCTPPSDSLGRLFAFLNHDVDAKLSFGKKAEGKSDKQPELPIGDEATEDETADDEGN